MEKNYSDLSKSLTNELSSSVKKKQGIFFTPKESIVTFSNFLKNVLKHQFKTVLNHPVDHVNLLSILMQQMKIFKSRASNTIRKYTNQFKDFLFKTMFKSFTKISLPMKQIKNLI